MIQNRDYPSLDQLLNIEQLTSLHLYIFLLAWTHVRTVNDAIVLHDSINSLKNENSMLIKCLQLFQSHIEFITWLHNVRRYAKKKINEFFCFFGIFRFYFYLIELICKLFLYFCYSLI